MKKIYNLKLKESEDLKSGGEKIDIMLGSAQREIDEVDKLDEKFLVCFNEVKKIVGISDLSSVSGEKYPQIYNLKNKIIEINKVAEETLNIENENKRVVKDMMSDLQKEITKMRQGKQGLKAYDKKSGNSDGYFIDSKK